MKTLLPLLRNLLTKNIRFISAAMLLLLFMCVSSNSQAQVHYTTSGSALTTEANDGLRSVNYDGSSAATIVSSLAGSPTATAIDYNGNRAFVYDNANSIKQIKIVSLPGGSVSATTITVPNVLTAIRYDAATDYIYYLTTSGSNTLAATDALRRVKSNGTGDEAVVTSITNSPVALALDLAHNTVYVLDKFTPNSTIKKVDFTNLSSPVITTVLTQTKMINGLDYNPNDGYIYFIQTDGSFSTKVADDAFLKISGSAVLGTPTVIASSIAYIPVSFALDAGNNRAFFYDGTTGAGALAREVRSVSFSGAVGSAIVSIPLGTSTIGISALNVPRPAVALTTAATSVSSVSATLNGSVQRSDIAVSERGVVYSSTNTTPTIGGTDVTKSVIGSGNGTIAASVSGLSGSTIYYFRTYGISNAGTGYGDVMSFTTQSNDATLSGLTISAGTLNPNFGSAIITYTATVANSNSSVTITPTKSNAGASILVNNIAATSGMGSIVNLNIGDNAIPVKVTAADGSTTKTYTITLTRPKAAQTITFAGTATKTFGDADFAPGATSSSGLGVSYSSDNLGVATIVSGQIHIVGAGTANITASQGGDGSYLAAGNAVQALTVNKASQTITFNAIPAKTYDVADFAPGATASSGLTVSYSSDNTAVATIVSNQIHIIGQGTANITASQSGDANRSAATSVAQSLTVNKATVTVTAVAKTKIYGDDDPAFTYTTSGVVGSDAPTGALSRVTPNTNRLIGTYAIDQGTLSYGTNYNITYVGANLTINKRPITILPGAKTKIYGDPDPFLNQYQFAAGSLAPGDGSSDQFGRAPGEGVGTYLMTLGNKIIVNGNDIVTSNYDITVQSAYFTITAKTINVTPNALTKVYGELDPDLTYSHDALAFNDTFSGSLTRFTGEDVNSYYLTVGDLELSNNYIMNFNYGNKLTITPKTINVIANAKTKTYGAADPTFDYTYDALAFTDSFTGSLTRDAGEGAGNHAITQGSLALNNNYTLNYIGANLSIGKATLTYVATPATRPFQTANPTFAGSVTGFISGDSQASATTGTLSFTSTASLNSALGSYPIVGSGLTAANYDFVQDASNNTAFTITASIDATLAGLTVDQGTLNPVFSSEGTSYGFSVANDVTSLNLTATVNQANASINFNGATITSGIAKNIALSTGNNNLNIIVTAQDGLTTQHYTLNVFRAYDTNNLLASLNLNGVTYSPAFDAGTLNYTAAVSNVVASTDVTATAVSPTTHIFVGGYDLATTNPVNTTLNVGETDVIVVSKAENGDEKIYKVTVTRGQSADATLTSIGNSTITLNTPFVSGTHTYSATVATGVGVLNFLPVSTNNAAIIKVNNQALNTGAGNNVALAFGANSVVIDVTSEDGLNHIPYVLNIYRLRSSNADLASLSFPFVTSINEPFDPNVLQYTADVADSTYTGIPLSAISADENAVVKIDGTVVPRFVNYTLPVQGGPNTYHVVVTSQDTSATKTYTLVLTRAGTPPPLQSPVANLYALNVNATGFSKNFNFTIGEQLTTVNVPNSIAAVRIFAVSENEVSTVTVDGVVLPYDATTDLLPIALGDNLFTIVVTSEDSVHTKTYELHVNRVPFADITLASLNINAGSLSPAFAPGTRTYTVSVPNNITSIGVTPVANDGTATVTIGATQISPSNPTATVNLSEGPPTNIRVVVLAADGVNKQTYVVSVTRQAPAPLSNIASANVSFDPSSVYAATTGTANVNYVTSVAPDISSIRVKATAQQAGATIRINGSVVTSGSFSDPITLNAGPTLINVNVTAEDGITVYSYSFKVNRNGSSNAKVNVALDPASTFVATTGTANSNYSTSVSPGVSSVRVKATALQADAVIRINGDIVASGTFSNPITLNAGPTVINIHVTAGDGVTVYTYSYTVNRNGSSNASANVSLDPASTFVTTTGTANINYMTSVSTDVTSVRVKAVAQQAGATIRVNGDIVASGAFSNPVILTAGATLINVSVTAEDGVTVYTYSFSVKHIGSSNASANITFDPASTFVTTTGSANVNYMTSVSQDVSSIRVKATAQQANAVIRINGNIVTSGVFSDPITLNTGSTLITVQVTAEDGVTVYSYSFTVNRNGSSNASANISFDPASVFIATTGSANVNYTTSVSPGVSSVRILATVQQANAVIRINGNIVTSGVYSAPITLSAGPTLITVQVTAEDGVTVYSYSYLVSRNGSSNASARIALNPSTTLTATTTGAGDANYTATVATGQSTIRVIPTVYYNAVVTVNGSVVTSGTASDPIALTAGGTTLITVLVTAEDGATVKTYTITVTRPTSLLLVDKADSKLLFANKAANEVAPTGDDGVVVHQGVSPNGDGSNDFLYIEGISAYPGNKVSIMNTSGALVFDTRDYGKDGNHLFDGHSNKNGALLKPGTYFYALEYQVGKQSKRKTGYIVIKY